TSVGGSCFARSTAASTTLRVVTTINHGPIALMFRGAALPKSYRKGYRFEHDAIEPLLKELDVGILTRAHQSGAYTGEPDFRLVLPDYSTFTFSCKKRAKNPSKFISDQCEKADFAVWGWDRSIPYIVGPFVKMNDFYRRVYEGKHEVNE